MPNLALLSGIEFKCNLEDFEDAARFGQTASGQKYDAAEVQAAYSKCVQDELRQSQANFDKSVAERKFEQQTNYAILAGVVLILLLIILFRRPIFKTLERIFISSAAKTILGKQNLAKYRSDLARRVREETEG